MLSANKNWVNLNVLFQPVIITALHHEWLSATGRTNSVLKNEEMKSFDNLCSPTPGTSFSAIYVVLVPGQQLYHLPHTYKGMGM